MVKLPWSLHSVRWKKGDNNQTNMNWWYYTCIMIIGYAFGNTFRRVRKTAKSDYVSSHLSVRPHGTTLLPMDGFSWSAIFELLFRISVAKVPSFIKIWQEWRVLYTKTYANLWYVAEFFLERRTVSNEGWREKSKHTLYARGPGSSVGVATELRAGRSGDRIPVAARFSAIPGLSRG